MLLGIDEVGRGPLAGPLVVGAVGLPDEKPEWVAELRDSKKLSAKKRAVLSEKIWAEAVVAGLGFVTPVEIDELGMSEALRLATRRAVKEVQKSGAEISRVVIDGKVNFLAGTELMGLVSTAVKADDLVKEVSAASIIAKHARDTYMIKVGERYPEYGFEKHMGYGTRTHMEAIRRVGICPEHRRSFAPINGMVGFVRAEVMRKNTTEVGKRGEEAVSEYLMARGHEIVARNFKTYDYEIDVVSRCEGRVYFTEVKTRRDDARGGGLAAVDGRKLQQMSYAAECLMGYYGWECDAALAVAAVRYVPRVDAYQVEEWTEL